MTDRFLDPDWVRAKPHSRGEKQVGHDDPQGRPDVINRAAKREWEDLKRIARTLYADPTLDGTATGALGAGLEKAVLAFDLAQVVGDDFLDELSADRTNLTLSNVLDFLVAIGGQNSGGSVLATTQLYDRGADVWINRANKPTAVRNHAATSNPAGTFIWCFGGQIGSGPYTPTNKADRYNAGNNTWSDGAILDLPAARASMTATLNAAASVIYLAGGNTSGGVDPGLLSYTLATNSYGTLTSMSTGREHHAAGMLSLFAAEKLIVAGGRDSGSNILSSTEIYDVATDAWSAGGTMLEAVTESPHAVVANALWVYTGLRNLGVPEVSPTIQFFRAHRNAWRKIADTIHVTTLSRARRLAGGATRQGRIYAAGGFRSSDTSAPTDTLVEAHAVVQLFVAPRNAVISTRDLRDYFPLSGLRTELVNMETGHMGDAVGVAKGDRVGLLVGDPLAERVFWEGGG